MKTHKYEITVNWVGNQGSGTSGYKDYERNFVIQADKKNDISGSADPAFLGDSTKWNPEELLLASVSACHKLWYLHLCAVNNIIVITYVDAPVGLMVEENPDNKGRFIEVTLNPTIHISTESKIELAHELHERAHQKCFIANSLNFPVKCQPKIVHFGNDF